MLLQDPIANLQATSRRRKNRTKYEYDGLDRLVVARRGYRDGGAFQHVPQNPAFTTSQEFDLDVLGNWDELATDVDGDGPGVGSDDIIDVRTHHDVNELTSGEPDGETLVQHSYDRAGNMLVEQMIAPRFSSVPIVDVSYTHDAWNRLVGVDYDAKDRADYVYNGLSWRILKTADTNASGTLDERRLMFYTSDWRLIEERIDEAPFDATPDPESVEIVGRTQNVWGPRYIDDIIAHRVDDNPIGGDYEATYYHLTDVQFSTVGIVDGAGSLLERVAYDPYGSARHQWAGDVDGDGAVLVNDRDIIEILLMTAPGRSIDISDPRYNVDADVNGDGEVSSADQTAIKNDQAGLPKGEISALGNTIGWDGYVLNPETLRYKIRNRDYSTTLGRWLERDPVEYDDGQNLYQYSRSDAMLFTDPFGLSTYRFGNEPPPPSDAQKQLESDRTYDSGTDLSWGTVAWIFYRASANRTGGFFVGLPQAARLHHHFLGESGEPYTVDFEEMNNVAWEARVHLESELYDAISHAEELGIDGETIEMVTDDESDARVSNHKDWHYAIHDYRTWARATVTRCGDEFTMDWEFNLRDFYDWEVGSPLKGGLVTDGEMASLHREGWAREFPLSGVHGMAVKWKLGERPGTDAIVKKGLKKKVQNQGRR